ncbi:ABC transporter permease [Alkalicella caledoniensis]|uniref:ABC transporter permease n=1 Tax=Alkalicella caledoniensis TaxID=2731377 RepID=A0A7G9W7C4_ALKCA|nr:FtsX-like permease family protein [Alkalicella caledoniensis]QNO14586.1 ABC transporter permease [Alkalicella caledoniensis]
MGILIKFILKSITEKKLRTLLILVAVIISTALFFASTTMPNTVSEIFLDSMTKYVGGSDIVITSGEGSPSPYFKADVITTSNDWDYAVTSVDSMALHRGEEFELTTVKLLGFDFHDIKQFNPYYLEQGSLKPLNNNEVVIGKGFSEHHGLELNDLVELEIFGQEHDFKIVGIAENKGPFMEDGQMIQFLVSPKKIHEVYGLADDYVSSIFIRSNSSDLDSTITDLSIKYDNLSVGHAIPQDDIDYMVSTIKMPFNIVLGLVFFISFFIIYTSFKLMMKERLPITGTFRSIGATKKLTSLVLMGETIVYALVGGTIGIFLGIGILKVISVSLTTGFGTGSEVVAIYSFTNIVLSFMAAFTITLVSGIAPILNSTKFSIKEIILNTMEKPKSKKMYKVVLGVSFIIFAIIVPSLANMYSLLAVTLLAMLFTIIAIVLLVPYATMFLVRIFEKILTGIFGNIGTLACKNIRNNKSIIGSVTLLAIAIALLLSINVVSYSVAQEVALTYDNYGNYASVIRANRLDENALEKTRSLDGVESATGIMTANHISVEGSDKKLIVLKGITPDYIDYWRLRIKPDDLAQLSDGNIIVTAKVSEIYGIEKGDNITFRVNGRKKDFTVVGTFESMSDNGDFSLITIEDFKSLFKAEFYTSIYTKGQDSESIAKKLREEFYHLNPFVTTLELQKRMNLENNAQVFGILSAFSVLAMISGLLGIINNLIISFIERKRSLAMYRSLGMSKLQIRNMILIESFTGGLVGGILGIMGSLVIIRNMPYLTKALAAYIPMHYQVSTFIYFLVAGVLVMVLASVSPALKSSKMNIIQSIKYE